MTLIQGQGSGRAMGGRLSAVDQTRKMVFDFWGRQTAIYIDKKTLKHTEPAEDDRTGGPGASRSCSAFAAAAGARRSPPAAAAKRQEARSTSLLG